MPFEHRCTVISLGSDGARHRSKVVQAPEHRGGLTSKGKASSDARDYARFGLNREAQEVLAQMDPDVCGVSVVEVIAQQRRSFRHKLARFEDARVLEVEPDGWVGN
jgi:hypothetical protein